MCISPGNCSVLLYLIFDQSFEVFCQQLSVVCVFFKSIAALTQIEMMLTCFSLNSWQNK